MYAELETESQDTRDAVKIQPMTASEIWRWRQNMDDLKELRGWRRRQSTHSSFKSSIPFVDYDLYCLTTMKSHYNYSYQSLVPIASLVMDCARCAFLNNPDFCPESSSDNQRKHLILCKRRHSSGVTLLYTKLAPNMC
ncbi:hypothetical protein Tco_0985475 [Tanacetum coccineum]